MSEALEPLAAFVAQQADELPKVLKELAKEGWRKFDETAREQVVEVAKDLATLMAHAVAGREVSREIAHCKAAMATWTFAGAAEAQLLVQRSVLTWLEGVKDLALGALQESAKALGKGALEALKDQAGDLF